MDECADDSPTDESESSAADWVVAGRYRVRGRLGRGAYKEVYFAYDERLDREVALAFVVGARGTASAAARLRFEREAQVTGRLGDHPNIITVYDTGEHDGVPYLVLRAMEGGTLADVVRERGVSIPEATRLGREIAAGLAHAHARGVVHRDVKPDNVWLAADGTAALGDFGVATRPDLERITAEGVVVGTVRYLSPEQIRGEEPTPASDLYALGITLYELVAGEAPFAAADPERVLTAHLTVAPAPLSEHAPDVPPALERLILGLLAKHPEQRPAGAALVEHELARMLSERRGEQAPALCPFKGLAAFEEADAPYFCGRDRLVARLVARLAEGSLVGILGPSGCGKSSVMRAGLLPALANGALPGSAHQAQALIRPGPHPRAELERALEAAVAQPLIVAVDQLEEVFVACEDERERVAFIDGLVAATREREPRCTVVLALRADFYGRCAAYPQLATLLAGNHVLVGPMRHDELRHVIEEPARRAGLRVESELVAALVDDVEGEPGALPLLSTALLELWQSRDGRRLTHAAYERVGGARGAVSRLAESAFDRLDDEQRQVARGVLLRLVVEGADGRVELRRLPRDELRTLPGGDGVVELLARSRLLTLDGGTVELAHEALLHEWPRLRDWVAESREGMRVQQRLSAAAADWLRLGRDEGAVYRGGRLDEALRWEASGMATLNALEQEFLAAGVAGRRRERAARLRRRVLGVAGVLAVGGAVAVAAAATISSSRGSRMQRDVEASGELASRSADVLASDPGLSRLIALRAVARRRTDAAERALRQATLADRATAILATGSGAIWSVMPGRRGRLAATAGDDGIVRVRDLRSGRVVRTVPASGGPVPAAGFSRDGRWVATAGADGHITVTGTAGGGEVQLTLPRLGPEPYEGANSVQFSADGGTLVLGGRDGTVRVLDRDDRRSRVIGRYVSDPRPHRPSGQAALPPADRAKRRSQEVVAAQLDASERRVVSVSSTGSARLWSVAGRSSRRRLGAKANDASFSPDGRRVATAGDEELRVWDARTGKAIGAPIPVLARQLSVRWSPDGDKLVTAAADGIVRVFDAVGGILLDELKGHDGLAYSADFADDDTVVSGGQDGTLRVWAPTAAHALKADAVPAPSFAAGRGDVLWGDADGSLHRWEPARGVDRVIGRSVLCGECAMRASADGSTIVAVSGDGEVRLSEVDAAGRRLLPVKTRGLAVAVDAGGRRVAVGGERPAVVRADGAGDPVELEGRPAAVSAMAFRPRRREVAVGSQDGALRIFDSDTGKQLRALPGHNDAIASVAYSDDGSRVVTAGEDRAIRVVPATGGPSLVLRGHEGAVSSAAFDPGGRRVVSAGQDGTVRVWDARSAKQLVVLERYATATSAAFNAEGSRVLSLGRDRRSKAMVLKVSSCDACGSFAAVRKAAQARAAPRLSAAEREQLRAAP